MRNTPRQPTPHSTFTTHIVTETQHSRQDLLQGVRVLSRKADRAGVLVMLLVDPGVQRFRVNQTMCPVKTAVQQLV